MRGWLAAGRRLTIKGRYTLTRTGERLRSVVSLRRPTLPLDLVQRRLDLMLTAMYGHPIQITTVDDASRHWLARALKFMRRDPRARESTPGVDGAAIHLPSRLSAREGVDGRDSTLPVVGRRASRAPLARHGGAYAPSWINFEHDLYLMREAAVVDSRIARTMPGMSTTLASERAASLSRRPRIQGLTRQERDVEDLLRKTLARPTGHATEVSEASDPADSLKWAKAMALSLRLSGGVYRGLPLALFWGTVLRRVETREGPGIAEDQSAKSAEKMPDAKAPPK